ncbi:MAG: DNRLRE domain-containing protein [Phycisphaerales bacterium]|nr:MAG: DNRLRE domain-containing protein [Phycisphaerales bacterium]
MTTRPSCSIALVLGLLLAPVVAAAVVNLTPSKDNTLYEDPNGNLSNGAGDGLFVGRNAHNGFIRRALLAFDLTSHVPPGSDIHSVTLTMRMARTTSDSQPVSPHRVLADWGQGASEADGSGAQATPGDATWIHTYYDSRFWSTAGGDFMQPDSASASVGDVGFYTWGTTAQMVADVQQWLDNPASNFGWMLIGNETESRTSKRFSSRESDNAAYRPLLSVSFTAPYDCNTPLAGDLDNDCTVGFSDFAIMAADWLADRTPQQTQPGTITIVGVGAFQFDPGQIVTVRPDIYKPGRFSAFDVLVHLDEQGRIDLAWHFSDEMNTCVIDSINGMSRWWYRCHYDGGKFEDNAVRMDHYPYKDKMEIRLEQVSQSRLDAMYAVFAEEVARRAMNDGKIIVPEVLIRGKTFGELRFENVLVEPHNLRADTFRDGVVTVIDTVMSLADRGKITCELKWYDSIGAAGVVRSYWVEQINQDRSSGRCGFVYNVGSRQLQIGRVVHIPSDWRILNSPEYVRYYWIELGSCEGEH